MKRRVLILFAAAALALIVMPALALAGPRSGSSFGGRRGFKSSPSSYSRPASRPVGGGGPSFIFFPGFGWGWGGGYGGGGGSAFGSLLMLGILGLGVFMVVRTVRRVRAARDPMGAGSFSDDDDEVAVAPGRAFVYKVQFGLGRSARGIQERLARFAADGDTSSEEGLASLLHQSALELMREKHSIRYGLVEASGPMNMTNGETKLNAAALAERSRFQVERVRGADGQVRRADIAPAESDEALEYLVVTLALATRTPLPALKELADSESLDAVLGELGGVPPRALLGLEVVWTPADPSDSMTEADLLTTYPNMRGL